MNKRSWVYSFSGIVTFSVLLGAYLLVQQVFAVDSRPIDMAESQNEECLGEEIQLKDYRIIAEDKKEVVLLYIAKVEYSERVYATLYVIMEDPKTGEMVVFQPSAAEFIKDKLNLRWVDKISVEVCRRDGQYFYRVLDG